MKVYTILLIIVFSFTTQIFSQVKFAPHTITSGLVAHAVYALFNTFDLNGELRILPVPLITEPKIVKVIN